MRKYFKGRLEISLFSATMLFLSFGTLILFIALGFLFHLFFPSVSFDWNILIISFLTPAVALFFTIRTRNRYYAKAAYGQSKSLHIFILFLSCVSVYMIVLSISVLYKQSVRDAVEIARNHEFYNNIEKETNGSLDSQKLMALLNNTYDSLYPDWKEYRSEEGHFRMNFPGFPGNYSVRNQLIDGIKYPIYQYSVVTDKYPHPNLGYTVAYTDMAHTSGKDSIDHILDLTRNSILSLTNSELQFEFEIDSGEYYGRHLYMNVDSSHIRINTYLYFKDTRLYTLSVVTNEGKLFNNAISMFLNSFRYLD